MRLTDTLEVFDGIDIDNRLHSPVDVRHEVRNRRLVIIIEPGRQRTGGGILLPHFVALDEKKH